MNRMDQIFKTLMERGDKILILYFPLGDTILGDSVEWAEKYFANGCTVLEIGLPFENPILDGRTVQESMERALTQITLDGAFDLIADIRKRCPDQILQIMTYHGNCMKYGYKEFAKKCYEAGVDAVLCPDADLEQLHQLDDALNEYEIRNMRFAPYHLDSEAVKEIETHTKGGYIFQQAVDGGTGPQASVSPKIGENVAMLKSAGIMAPVCAGFGISNSEQVREALSYGADGVIVGSAVIQHIKDGDGEAFIAELGQASKG